MPGTSAALALTHFDTLTTLFAKRGGNLSGIQKQMLDRALSSYAEACEKLRLPAHQDHSGKVVLPEHMSGDWAASSDQPTGEK